MRPWATCQVVGDALSFASALGYMYVAVLRMFTAKPHRGARRRSQIYKRGYVFRRGPLVIQMFQQEVVCSATQPPIFSGVIFRTIQVDPKTQKPIPAHADTLWEVEVKTAAPVRNTQETPLSRSVDAVLEVQLLMKGLLDLRRQDV